MGKEDLDSRSYEWLIGIKKGRDVVVRDDQHEFSWLLDAARTCRHKGHRFLLIDSGRLDLFSLEWLADRGASIYSSDEVRTNQQELELLKKTCRKSGAIVAYFFHGSFDEEEKNSLSFRELMALAKNGLYIHISNRNERYDFSRLSELSWECQNGRSWLVYYHHGALDQSLEELARSGAWIHLSDQSLQIEKDIACLVEVSKAYPSQAKRIVLFIEKGLPYVSLQSLHEKGLFLLFKTPPTDYRSPLRTIEREAKKKKLDFRAYWLDTSFIP